MVPGCHVTQNEKEKGMELEMDHGVWDEALLDSDCHDCKVICKIQKLYLISDLVRLSLDEIFQNIKFVMQISASSQHPISKLMTPLDS